MFLNMANGNAFNFRVVAFSSYESMILYTMPENTIGVEVNRNSYDRIVVSPTQPEPFEDEYHYERLLWIKTDTEGPVNVQVTKYIPVHAIPTNVYLCTKGEVKLLRAAVYVNGKWVSISKLDALSEDWSGRAKGYSGAGGSLVSTFEDGCLVVDFTENRWGTSAKTGTWLTDGNLYDLTNYKKLTFKGYFTKENSNSYGIYGVWTTDENKSYKEDVPLKWETTEDNTNDVVLDVSELKGEHYIGVGIRSCKVRIDECYLEM